MASQFFGLNISFTGLMSANAGLNTTSNNISNIETVGYSKQVATQEARDAIRTFTKYGCAGAGVETIAIERLRDKFYDTKYWNNESQSGEYGIKSYYMKQIEDYFRDDDTIKGFNTIFDEMYNALNELKSNAGDVTVKSQFIGATKNLSIYFNQQYSNLRKMQLDTNSEIKIKADKINTLANSIASLNKQINVVEVGGGAANELRDQRDLLLDDLSKIVDVEVEEFPAIDVNHPEMDTGSNHFRVKIAGGQLLVDTDEYNEIVCVARKDDEKVNLTDADGLYDLYWATPGQEFDVKTAPKFNVYGTNLGGELKALIQMRDGNNGENFNGKIKEVSTVGGKQQVKIKAYDADLMDINKLNLSNTGGKITLDNTVMYYDDWQMQKVGDECIYTFTLSDSTKNPVEFPSYKSMVDPDDANAIQYDAVIGSEIHYQGIPYYMRQLNEWVRCYSKVFNEIVGEGVVNDGSDGGVAKAKDAFVANDLRNGGQIDIDDSITEDTGVSMSDKSYFYLTAENFAISSRIEDDATQLPTYSEMLTTTSNTSSGASKHDVLDKLIDLRTNRDVMVFRGASAGDFLQSTMADITLGCNTANLFSKNFTDISAAIDTQRQSVSSVDSDEESLSLVKYQNAYTLSSKMISTLTEIYDQLILNTGV